MTAPKYEGIHAEYVQHSGDDLTVVNAARVSFDKESDWEVECTESDYRVILSSSDERLIKYLANHDHWTPFAHNSITIRETVPIFVARQRFKHTVGFVYNEVSRRYSDSEPTFFKPSDGWRARAENVKQGSKEDEFVKNLSMRGFLENPVEDAYKRLLDHSLLLYADMLENGVAPELARMVLPQSMMTSYYVTGSLAAFARAYKLRADNHAQKEIRDLAVLWDAIIRPLFPVAWSALIDNQVPSNPVPPS